MNTDPIRAALVRLLCVDPSNDRKFYEAIVAARAALAAAPPITYEWSITVDDEGVAGGGGPDLLEVERDAAHYLQQYERDGAAVLQIRAVQIIKEITP